MRTPLTWVEKIVGLFIVLTFVVLGAALFISAQRRGVFSAWRSFLVVLERGHNIKKGSPIFIQDVEAGAVADVTIERVKTLVDRFGVEKLEKRLPGIKDLHSVVVVTCEIEERFADDVSEATSTCTIDKPLIGPTRIDIAAGEPSDTVPPPPTLRQAKGKELPIFNVETPPSILEKLQDVDLEEIQGRVVAALEKIEETIGNVRDATEAMAEGRGTVGMLLQDEGLAAEIRSAIAEVALAAQDVRRIAARGAEMAEVFPATGQAAQRTVEQLERSVARLDEVVVEVRPILTRILAEVQVILKDVREATSGVPEVVRKVDALLVETNRVIDAVKSSFLVRGGLSPAAEPPPHELERVPRWER